jgi:hypothetical protein
MGDLRGDAWTRSFAGKEIFVDLRAPVSGLDLGGDERDKDLARRVVEEMRTGNREPPDLMHLREVIRKRARI